MMNTFTLSLSLLALSFTSFSQTIIVSEDFESYTANQHLAQQSSLWETWSGSTGGTDDAIVSSDFALSGSNSLLIYHDNDMILPIGNYNSGHFIIEFNAFMIEEAYFNIMHTCQSSWAFDLYLTANNEVKYLDVPNVSNCVVIDSYSNNEWVNFRFDINIDLDSVSTYVNNVKRHQSVWSNAATGSTGSGLRCVNFFGLAGFNGVDHANYHIDDIVITQLNTSELPEEEAITVNVYPNPAIETIEITSDEPITNVLLFDCLGKELMNSTSTSLNVSSLDNGVYHALITTESGIARKEIIVQH